jgi:signal transduction histidine kinase
VQERTQELQTALEAQRAAKRLAEEANATKTRFVAAASHDLLQPLNAARLFASALEEHSTDVGVIEIAGRIDSSMRAAEEVLDDMLDIARLESGTMRTEVTDFDLADMYEDLERQFAPLAARRGLRLRVTRPRCHVHSDRVLLRRVLQNLVSNALRYTRQGGVLVGCQRRGRFVDLCVWDTGPGIPESHQRAIFEEFRRLDGPSASASRSATASRGCWGSSSACARRRAAARCSASGCHWALRQPPRRLHRPKRHRPRHRRAWWDSGCSASTTSPRSSRA